MTDPIDGTVPFDNSSGEWEFRWYLNGADIPIAVNNTPYFSPTIAGNYTVQAVNFNTCLIYETQTVGGVGFEVVEIINCKNCP